MNNSVERSQRCLGCYQSLDNGMYHPKCSLKLFGHSIPPEIESTTDQLEEVAQRFLNQRLTVTGVQRKLSLQLGPKSSNRLTIVGTLGGNYIMKPQSPEFEELPENEDLCMHLAESCGIQTAQHGLLPLADGKLAYLTKRFDRSKTGKIAVEDLCQLSGLLTEQKYRPSYEKTGKIIRKYSSIPGDDTLRYFELLVFSYIIGNNDMHLKNFSLLTNNSERVVLSPAYDLLSVRLLLSEQDDPEEMALSLNGKKNKITHSDFIKLSENLKIPPKVAKATIERICKQCRESSTLVEQSFLSAEGKQKIADAIKKNSQAILS